MRILISGGGIAGPALAHALSSLPASSVSHTITILERSPTLRAAGQQVDLRGPGLKAATRLGLLPSLRSLIVEEEGAQIVNSEGVTKAYFGGGKKDDMSFSAEFELMRGDICKMLYEKTEGKKGITWKFGTSIESWEDDESGTLKVKLSDGTQQECDLLVAADGQGSRIRKAMLSKAGSQDRTKDLGLSAAYFSIPRLPDDKPIATMYQAPGRGGFVYATRFHSPTKGQGYLMTMSKDEKLLAAVNGGSMEQKKEVFAEMFRGRGWQADRLVDAMLQESDDVYMSSTVQVKSDIWSHKNVVLLGDAGYCPAPVTGQGTSLAMIGTYVLAGELSQIDSEHKTLDAALEAYETKLRPLVEKEQYLPSFVPGIAYPETKFGVWLTQFVLGLVSKLPLDWIASQFAKRQKESWKMPSYPILEEAFGTEEDVDKA